MKTLLSIASTYFFNQKKGCAFLALKSSQIYRNILGIAMFGCLFFFQNIKAQDITLFQQYNGQYDFTFIGNTLQPQENTFQTSPQILDASAATLNLAPTQQLVNAYLYWAGSGTGDFEVKLNDEVILAERTFSHSININFNNYQFFSAFADITTLIETHGNGDYVFTDLDISEFLPSHFNIRTNFAGWAILIIYTDENLPQNQLNVYDGLQGVPDEINITLSSLNVIDNQDAKIGFIAWEGDVGLAVNETLRINGNIISDPPLNPANNAFNGTNSILGISTLYNMDLDIYSIENNIQIGDQSAEISLTSGQDFVMVNTIITKLNSQLPDAVIQIDDFDIYCDQTDLTVHYTVENLSEATNPLATGTPIAFYINEILVAQTNTQNSIPIGGSESGVITFNLSPNFENPLTLKIVVNDTGDGSILVQEIDYTNNTSIATFDRITTPIFENPPGLTVCNLGFGRGVFDFSDYYDFWTFENDTPVSFHESYEAAVQNSNPILNPENFEAQQTPFTVYVRIESDPCPSIAQFELHTENCPPTVYNFISANGDGYNDFFYIEGLRDIFLDFEIFIFNRWGVKIWSGNQNTEDWRGEVSERNTLYGQLAPAGTYYYIIKVNDPDYPTPFSGFVYITY